VGTHGYSWILKKYADIRITYTRTDTGTRWIFIQRIGYRRAIIRTLSTSLTSLLTRCIFINPTVCWIYCFTQSNWYWTTN